MGHADLGDSMATDTLRLDAMLLSFARTARARGDAPAVIDERRTLTYRDFLAETERQAHALRNAGVRSGDRVAIVAENSASFLTTVFSLWWVDAVPVTIYPSTSRDDLDVTVQDADPVLVFCDDTTEDLVRDAVGDRVPVARLDGPAATLGRSAKARLTPEHLRSRVALICYSSGTTARPKAIMLSADAISNSAQTFASSWRLTAEDVTLVCLPMAWLFGLTTASVSTLVQGGTVVSLRRARPEAVVHAIQESHVTFVPAVATVLTKLANYLDQNVVPLGFPSLRLIVSGGEPRNEDAFARLRVHTGLPVHDNYCASEMQPLVTYDPERDPEPRPGSAGRLVPRSSLRILDEEGAPVAEGDIGEAYSHGPGIMLGYWNDEAATRRALTDDGWYRTRDLVRIDRDGYVYVVGRVSDMIIRGGSNVSPGEVEQRLRLHDSLADVAVVGTPDPVYGEEVTAVVQLQPGVAMDAQALRAFAEGGLSNFKVPTRYLAIDELPHNSTTGKVDRKEVIRRLREGEIA